MATKTKNTKTVKADKPIDRAEQATKVVQMRTVDLMTWRQIGDAFGVSPATARALFNEGVGGKGQHHDRLPGKGGRTAQGVRTSNKKATGVLAGDGTYSKWVPVKAD